MRTSYRYKTVFLVLFCVVCLCAGCGKEDEGDNGPVGQLGGPGHNFSKAVIETSYDSNQDAIAGDGFLFTVNEETKEASLVSYYDVDLLEVTLPDAIIYNDVEYLVTSIGESAFESDQSIEKLQLGKNIRTIQPSAFYSAAALKELIFLDALESIGERAFSQCTALQEITWGKSVTTVGNSAFEGDVEIRTLHLPGAVAAWGDEVFMDCIGLTECVFGKGSETIGKGMFVNCSKLQKVTIPDGVTTIGAEAFWDCSSLKEISLPDSVKSIGDQAFYSTAIQNLRLPVHLPTVKHELLDGIDNLTGISVPADRKEEYESVFQNYGLEITTY